MHWGRRADRSVTRKDRRSKSRKGPDAQVEDDDHKKTKYVTHYAELELTGIAGSCDGSLLAIAMHNKDPGLLPCIYLSPRISSRWPRSCSRQDGTLTRPTLDYLCAEVRLRLTERGTDPTYLMHKHGDDSGGFLPRR
jgi:hypothetical protein